MANKNMRNLMMVECIVFEACANDLMPPYLHPLHFLSVFFIPLTFIIGSVLLRILSRASLQTVLIVKFITFL